MADTRSFFDVLEQQIRTDLRREIEAEVRAEMSQARPEPRDPKKDALADRLETWLLTNVSRATFGRKTGYATSKSRPEATPTPAPEVSATEPSIAITTVEATCALELLLRHSGTKVASNSSLTESQLKSMWRRAALKTHPDRFVGEDPIVQLQKAALFRELVNAYECLQYLFDQSSAA